MVDAGMLQGLGVVGTVLSNCLAFSNLPAMMQARNIGSLGDINPLVFPFLFGNGCSWIMYSVAKKVHAMQAQRVPCHSFALLRRRVAFFRCFHSLSLYGFVYSKDGTIADTENSRGRTEISLSAWQDPFMFVGNIFGALLGLLYCTTALGLTKCPKKQLKIELV